MPTRLAALTQENLFLVMQFILEIILCPRVLTNNQQYPNQVVNQNIMLWILIAAANVKLFINLLQDLRVFLSLPLILLCNNKSLIFLVVNHITHKHSKHFDLDYHFVKE